MILAFSSPYSYPHSLPLPYRYSTRKLYPTQTHLLSQPLNRYQTFPPPSLPLSIVTPPTRIQRPPKNKTWAVLYVLSEVIEMDDVARISFPHCRNAKRRKKPPGDPGPPFPLRRSSVSYLFIGLSYHKRHGNCAGWALALNRTTP